MKVDRTRQCQEVGPYGRQCSAYLGHPGGSHSSDTPPARLAIDPPHAAPGWVGHPVYEAGRAYESKVHYTQAALLEAEIIGLRDLLSEVRDALLENDGRIGRASTLMCRITAAIADDLRRAAAQPKGGNHGG